MRNVIESVGGSIGCAGSGVSDLGRADRVRDGRLRQPGDRDDVARLRLVDRRALQAAEGQHLGDAALLDQAAVAVEHLGGLDSAGSSPT